MYNHYFFISNRSLCKYSKWRRINCYYKLYLHYGNFFQYQQIMRDHLVIPHTHLTAQANTFPAYQTYIFFISCHCLSRRVKTTSDLWWSPWRLCLLENVRNCCLILALISEGAIVLMWVAGGYRISSSEWPHTFGIGNAYQVSICSDSSSLTPHETQDQIP